DRRAHRRLRRLLAGRLGTRADAAAAALDARHRADLVLDAARDRRVRARPERLRPARGRRADDGAAAGRELDGDRVPRRRRPGRADGPREQRRAHDRALRCAARPAARRAAPVDRLAPAHRGGADPAPARAAGRGHRDRADPERAEPLRARRAAYARSFSRSSRLTTFGSALPCVSRITWPTKKPSTPSLPPRYVATCPGFAARIA